MQILKMEHYKMRLAPQNQALPINNIPPSFNGEEWKTNLWWPRRIPSALECYCFPPPSLPPPSVQTKLQPTFQTSFKGTTQWLTEP